MTKALGDTDIKRLNRQWRRRTEGRVALLLCGLTSPFNTGSIIRSAAVFGVETLFISGSTPDPDGASVGKMAMGTQRHLEVVRVEPGAEGVDEVASHGWVPVALELTDTAVPLHEAQLPSPVCLVVGNEGHGLAATTLARCQSGVYLPQPGKVASLNVAVATAAALHELRRQEWANGAGPDSTPGS